jgi:phage terminase large subunit
MQEKKLGELGRITREEEPFLEVVRKVQYILVWMRISLETTMKKAGEVPQNEEKARCKEDIVHFINWWAWAYEPRNVELGMSTKFPLILYKKQMDVVKELEVCWKSRQNAIVVKSRGAGISWAFCAMDINHFVFYPGFSAIYGSEKEEKVDVLGDVNSLFGKLRYVLYCLPSWMRPETFKDKTVKSPNDNERRLINPTNGAKIIGEIGENIGRSGRASVVRIDESQDLSKPARVNSSLESVTNCRVDVGTPNGLNDFGQRAENGMTYRIDIGWEDDPRLNPDWITGKRNLECPWRKFVEATKSKVVIAQEWDRNFNASVEGAVIPAEWVAAAIDFDIPEDESDIAAGFDVAGSGANKSVYGVRKGPVLTKIKEIPFDTATEAALAVFDEGEEDGIGLLNYDLDGLGESVFGIVKVSERKPRFDINGIRGNYKASDKQVPEEDRSASQKYRNKRAELGFSLRKRFENTYEHRNGIKQHAPGEMISIPNNPKLITQLSQPKVVYTGAKIGIESKVDMKRRGVVSPDYYDTCVYTFADYDLDDRVFSAASYKEKDSQFRKVEVKFGDPSYEQLVSLVHDDDMNAYALCCFWKAAGDQRLVIHAEIVLPNALPEDVVYDIKFHASPQKHPVSFYIGNQELFKEGAQNRLLTQYRHEKLWLVKNKNEDVLGSIVMINRMLDKRIMIIGNECERLFSQVRDYKKSKNEPGKMSGLIVALCQIVTWLRVKKEIKLDTNGFRSYESGPYSFKETQKENVDHTHDWMLAGGL